MKLLLIAVGLTLVFSFVQGQFRFANHYGDHMVLQRAPKRAVIWGYGTLGHLVEISVAGQTIETEVRLGEKGNPIWRITLFAVSEAGPYTVKATAGATTIQLNDVMFGDVWLCSGQSNMEFTVNLMDGGQGELERAENYPNIRVMTVERDTATDTREELKGTKLRWSRPSRESVGGPDFNYFSAVCWIFGKELHKALGYPVGLIATSWSGTSIESWSSKEAIAKCPAEQYSGNRNVSGLSTRDDVPREPMVLYNAMIHPLTSLTIMGITWYQGESNAWSWKQYACQQPAMIDDWRQKWLRGTSGQTDPVFPFGFVQLGTWQHRDQENGWPFMRWYGQTTGYGYVPNDNMPHTFMAVAIDLTDIPGGKYGPIHPRYKREVGERLSYGALNVGYGRTHVKHQGPFPTSITLEGGVIVKVIYDGGNARLDIRQSTGFEVCCASVDTDLECTAGGRWTSALIASSTLTSVSLEVSDCHGSFITALRYLWRETPCDLRSCAVYGRENLLPAPPYLYSGLIGYVV